MPLIKKFAITFFVISFGKINSAEIDNIALIKKLEIKMKISNYIEIRYIPNGSIGVASIAIDEVMKEWKYKLILNCKDNCSGRTESQLKSFVRKSVEQDEMCPPSLNTLIIFRDKNNKEVFHIPIDQSGHCFIFNKKPYYSYEKYIPLFSVKDLL